MCFGSKTETTQISKRNPEPEELTNLRLGLYNAIYPGLQNFDANSWTQAQNIANNALTTQSNLLEQVPTALNQSNELLSNLVNVVNTGNIPTALTDAMNASVNTNLQNSMGNMLNGLSNRGVLNSSITSQGVNNLSNAAANAFNQNYQSAFQSVLGGLGSALQGAQNNAGTLLSTINAIGNLPQQAYAGVSAQLMPAYNMWGDWQSSYDNREDYDTVVTQKPRGLF